jgi:HAD superfamily hydrolase (TIGR01484 family)
MSNSISSPYKAQRPRKKVLFLSDLDGTWLSKSPSNRAQLDREIFEIRDEYADKGLDLKFGYITARPPERVEKESLPTPDWTVTYNGAQVNVGDPGDFNGNGLFTEHQRFDKWDQKNEKTGFEAEAAYGELRNLLRTEKFSNLSFKTVGQVVQNPAADANQFTTSLCFDQAQVRLTPEEKKDLNNNGVADVFEAETFQAPEQIKELAQTLGAKLADAGIGHQVSPAYLFHGKPYIMFDVASPLANKGEAVSFLQQEERVTPEHVIVAGDGGNDISMMTGRNGRDEGRRSIVVGGDSGLVSAASGLKNAIIQPAELDSAQGVLSGLRQHLDSIVTE